MGKVDRKSLEEQADLYGIPWTFDTSTEELQKIVAQNTSDGDGEPTPPPDGPEDIPDIEGMEKDGLKSPACYGLFYAGWMPNEDGEGCRGCLFEDECKSIVLSKTIPGLIGKFVAQGTPPNAHNVARVLEIGIDEAEMVLAKYAEHKEQEKIMAKKAPAPKKVKMTVPKAPPPAPKAKVAVPKAPPPAPKGKKAPAKAAKAEKAIPVPTPAVEAPPAKRAGASAAMKPEDIVRLVTQPDATIAQGKKRAEEWGPEHDKDRWQRERERSTALAQLTPGTKLTREWRGESYEVKVTKNGYKFRGTLYPTLYAVTKLITGTREHPRQVVAGKRPSGSRRLCNWSAVRFWKIGSEKA